MKNILCFAFIVIIGLRIQLNAQVLYFNGLGRALVTNDALSGNILDNDTKTPRKGTGGYTMFDLGVNIQPSDYLRVSATLRVRNEFGGFYGDGAQLAFRQMKLEGIISKKVKYEVGDIDLSLTPYTLFNFYETYYEHEAEIFSIRRSVVDYENFNFGNKWRLQGANVSTNLKFEKGIEKIGLRGFVTRIARANYFNNSVPDRLLSGGRIDLLQSKFFQIGFNYVEMSDLGGTSPSPAVVLDNKVATGDMKINLEVNKILFSIYGEGGGSAYRYSNQDSARKKEDYFYDGGVSATYKPLNLKLYVNYRNVGSAFNSPSAQTRRIFDWGTTSLFPTYVMNASTPLAYNVNRVSNLSDRFSDEGSKNDQNSRTFRNTTILDTLVQYDPKYNNVTPYGIATPNRQGFTFGVSAGDKEKIINGDLSVDMLTEIRGEINNGLRNYMAIKGGLTFNIHKLLHIEKMIVLSAGLSNEQTKRNLAPNLIDLKSTLIDAGIVYEFVKSFDLLVGYKTLNAKGNEFYSRRDVFNEVVTNNVKIVNFNYSESVVATGFRYRFSKNSYATLQYHMISVNDKYISKDYKINQLYINYTLVF